MPLSEEKRFLEVLNAAIGKCPDPHFWSSLSISLSHGFHLSFSFDVSVFMLIFILIEKVLLSSTIPVKSSGETSLSRRGWLAMVVYLEFSLIIFPPELGK